MQICACGLTVPSARHHKSMRSRIFSEFKKAPVQKTSVESKLGAQQNKNGPQTLVLRNITVSTANRTEVVFNMLPWFQRSTQFEALHSTPPSISSCVAAKNRHWSQSETSEKVLISNHASFVPPPQIFHD